MKISKHLGIRFRVILLTSVLFCGIAAIETTAIQAQIFSLGIYPPLLEVMMMPGKSITQVFRLENSGDEMILNTQIVPFEPADEFGNISLRGSTSGEVEPPKNWFNFENADISLGKPFVLKAGQTKQIVLRIKIPQDTREDDYYFTFLFSSEPSARISGTATQEAGVIGANILLTVSRTGKPVKKGEVIEFSTQHFCLLSSPASLREAGRAVFCLPILDSFDKPEFLLRVKNTGRAFWKPFGKIKIEGILGQKWEQELLPENVLAGSIRQIRVATESARLDSARLAQPAFLVGPYRAKAEFSLDEEGGSQISSTAISFLALPIKALIGVLTGCVIVFIIKSRAVQ